MYNLRPEASTRRRRLLQGQKPWSMVAGAAPGDGAGFDVALFVGYHARAGHPHRDDRRTPTPAARSRRG